MLDFLSFSLFVVCVCVCFYCLPAGGFVDDGRSATSGLYRPGFQEMKEACKVRVEHSNHLVPVPCVSRRLPPLMLFVSLSFFPSCAGWCFSIISLAFGTAFVSNTFNNSVPREDSRSKHPSRFVAQFHRSHSIHFKMEVCTVFTSARHALHCPTHQRKVDLLTII